MLLTPIHYSVQFRHPQIVEYLIENGADISMRDKYQRTPLRFAMFTKNNKVIDILKKNGAML